MDMKNLENKKEMKSETKTSKKQKQLHADYFHLTCKEDKPSQASVSHQKSFSLKQGESRE
jgi:hypothetical protein